MPAGVSCFSFLFVQVFQNLQARNGMRAHTLCMYMNNLKETISKDECETAFYI